MLDCTVTEPSHYQFLILHGEKCRSYPSNREEVDPSHSCAKSVLLHRDIVGYVQQGKGGFGFGGVPPLWQKALATDYRAMVVEKVRRQEDATRCSKAVVQAKQGR